MALAIGAIYLPIRALPDRKQIPSARIALTYVPVRLPAATRPFRLAGSWELSANDRRFGGLSSLSIDEGRFIAVSDLGAVIRFGIPASSPSESEIGDLRAGPGPWGKKWSRDAESITPDPKGRGWWIGYEQRHSLWLYDPTFARQLDSIDLNRDDWWDNRGAEALIADGDGLLVLAENGHDAMRIRPSGIQRLPLNAGADVAEAARAPDGSIWLLLRSKGWGGIRQKVAPLVWSGTGFRVEEGMPLPKAAFDNFEGMTIEQRPEGSWRFWLITDNGHRLMARTLLVALDYMPPARRDKRPAPGTGLLKLP